MSLHAPRSCQELNRTAEQAAAEHPWRTGCPLLRRNILHFRTKAQPPASYLHAFGYDHLVRFTYHMTRRCPGRNVSFEYDVRCTTKITPPLAALSKIKGRTAEERRLSYIIPGTVPGVNRPMPNINISIRFVHTNQGTHIIPWPTE